MVGALSLAPFHPSFEWWFSEAKRAVAAAPSVRHRRFTTPRCGFFPFPGQTLYGASKAAVKLLTEGLYAEMIGTNVHVTVVFPGAIATNITQNSGVTSNISDPSSSSIPMTTPEKAAETIVTGMEKNKFQVYIGTDARMMNLLYKIVPRWATRFMQGRMKGMID